MTVGEVINKLYKYPLDMRCMIKRVDECGIEDIKIIGIVKVKYDDTPKSTYCCSGHEEHEEGEESLLISCK